MKFSVSPSHRLLVGEGRYVVLEKQFLNVDELQDWLAVNTLLPKESIALLLASGEVKFGEGNNEEWFKYLPPRP